MWPRWVPRHDGTDRNHAAPAFHERRWLVAAIFASVGFSLLLAFLVPAGQPYDEPSHWGTTTYYVDNHRMPELGEPGVTYEAQNGPVAYGILAVVVQPVDAAFGQKAGFRAGHTLSSFFLIAVVLLSWDLARQLSPSRPRLAVGSAALVGMTPTVVAYSASIQNDTTVLVLALAAACLGVRLLAQPAGAPDRYQWAKWLLLGVLIGLGTLAKVQALLLLPALLVTATIAPVHQRRRLLTGAAVSTAGVAATAGWWFIRNQRLYGDALATQSGFELTGVDSSSLSLSAGSVAKLGRTVISVAWAPTEYYRNAFEAPLPLRMLAILATVAVVGAALVGAERVDARARGTGPVEIMIGWRARPEVVFMGLWVAATIASWLVVVFTSSNLSPRVLTIVAAPVVIGAGVAIAGLRASRRWGSVPIALGLGTIAFAALVNVWIAYEVVKIPPQGFWIANVGWPAPNDSP